MELQKQNSESPTGVIVTVALLTPCDWNIPHHPGIDKKAVVHIEFPPPAAFQWKLHDIIKSAVVEMHIIGVISALLHIDISHVGKCTIFERYIIGVITRDIERERNGSSVIHVMPVRAVAEKAVYKSTVEMFSS